MIDIKKDLVDHLFNIYADDKSIKLDYNIIDSIITQSNLNFLQKCITPKNIIETLKKYTMLTKTYKIVNTLLRKLCDDLYHKIWKQRCKKFKDMKKLFCISKKHKLKQSTNPNIVSTNQRIHNIPPDTWILWIKTAIISGDSWMDF